MQYDVIISGGGIVGAVTACLLGQAGRRVAVIESKMPADDYSDQAAFSLRVSAISRASQQVLQSIGIWSGIQARRLTPYRKMVVWDATGGGEICFDANELGEPELGHIIENNVIQLALLDGIKTADNIDWICPARLQRFSVTDEAVHVSLDNTQELSARLLIGADGANSNVRQLANIDWQREDYGQKGLVCVVKTSASHQHTAWQQFTPDGPLAFLPLPDKKYCSIVWSLPADKADVMQNQAASLFAKQLSDAFALRLGNVEEVGPRASFPLYGAHAETYVAARVALIGDAIHTIHPLAGQGVNLGISDAYELAQQLSEVSTVDLGERKVLRRFERARKHENMLTLKVMEGFDLLFGNQQPMLLLARNQGLRLMNRLPLVKNSLAKHAMGI